MDLTLIYSDPDPHIARYPYLDLIKKLMTKIGIFFLLHVQHLKINFKYVVLVNSFNLM